MLNSLTIRNFGIIESAQIEFTRGLNVLTGETGAGKSILIDALRFALGDRFQTSSLRDQSDQCLVEAIFQLSPRLKSAIPEIENFPGDDDTLILQRSANRDGKNKIRINGLSATVAQLKSLGDRLVDLHGPHDHQLLLAESMHPVILDSLCNLTPYLASYRSDFDIYRQAKQQLSDLKSMARDRERDLDMLQHHIRELEQVPLTDEHYEQNRQDQARIKNNEKLFRDISSAIIVLDGEDGNLDSLLARSARPLENLSRTDPAAENFVERLTSLQEQSRELLAELRNYADRLRFDENQAAEICRQTDAYHDILKKFGPTIDDAARYLAEARNKALLLSDLEHNEETLVQKLSAAEKSLAVKADALSKIRSKTAAILKRTIETELRDLGFKNITFETRLERADFSPEGRDRAVFYISPNTGESLKPLADIVSSGESARIMLAIKKALMAVDPVPVLIFDEIDAQIGGRLGTVIGSKLREIADHRQVILITHLPQIAAFSQRHFKISKSTAQGRTRTEVEILNLQKQLTEMAQMMSGEKVTEISLQHARDMLKSANSAQKS